MSECGSDRVVCVGGTSDPPYNTGGCDNDRCKLVGSGRKGAQVGVPCTPVGAKGTGGIRGKPRQLPAGRAGSYRGSMGCV
jgi:hypothetical protein